MTANLPYPREISHGKGANKLQRHFFDNPFISMERDRVNIIELFHSKREAGQYVKICAPMVRYSKLEFRQLVRRYDVDLCYTPMLLADSFHRSEKCRQNDLSTNSEDVPLIVQFAANNSVDLLRAAEASYPYIDGVDLNCGCPQGWAMKMGMGSALLKCPEKVAELVSTVKRNLPELTVSTKLRILEDKSENINVELARRLEKCGADFITIHGRTPTQKSNQPVNWEEIGVIKSAVDIPVVGNGGVNTLEEADSCQKLANCDGIMIANAILLNPAVFAGFDETPQDCIRYFLLLAKHIKWQLYQHHLSFMTERHLDKFQRKTLNRLKTNRAIFEFINLQFYFGLDFDKDSIDLEKTKCIYPEQFHSADQVDKDEEEEEFTDGKYFKEKFSYLNEVEDEVYSDMNAMFG